MTVIWQSFANLTIDDFNKIVLALVALVALFLGPFMQYKIAKRQVEMQKEIADKQTETQRQIAARQVADNISSKRQAWINELRSDSAEALSYLARIAELKRPAAKLDDESARKNFEDLAVANFRAHELLVRIKLRLNANEEDHQKLDELFKNLSAQTAGASPGETEEQRNESIRRFQLARKEVLDHLQMILKKEWERVKRGDL